MPAQTVVITCSALTTSVACPDGTSGTLPPAGENFYYLFKHGPYPSDQYGPYPNLTGKDLEALGHAAGLRPGPPASRS